MCINIIAVCSVLWCVRVCRCVCVCVYTNKHATVYLKAPELSSIAVVVFKHESISVYNTCSVQGRSIIWINRFGAR